MSSEVDIYKQKLASDPLDMSAFSALRNFYMKNSLFGELAELQEMRASHLGSDGEAADLFHRARCLGVPVLDALGLVGDHQVRCPGVDQVEVTPHCVVIGDLESNRLCKLPGTFAFRPADHQGIMTGQTPYLISPLMLQRGRAYDQYPFGVEMLQQDLGRGSRQSCSTSNSARARFSNVGVQRRPGRKAIWRSPP